MNTLIRMYLMFVVVDIVATVILFILTQGTIIVFVSSLPTIALLAIIIPIQRMINQINKKIKEQNGKCYNCNQNMDEDTAILEDNNHVYCQSCNRSLFPNKYYQDKDGIWRVKDGSEKC